MADIKHTLGFWRAEEHLCSVATTILTDDPSATSGKRIIAQFVLIDDARLGAAAPDLLAAATAAEAVLSRGRWVEGSTDPEAVALCKLRAALSKASGVSHE